MSNPDPLANLDRIRNTGEKCVKDGLLQLGYRIFYQQCRNFRFCSKRTGFTTRHALLQSSTPRKTQKVISQWNIFACSTTWITVNMDRVRRWKRKHKSEFINRYICVYNLCTVLLVGHFLYEYKNNRFLSLFRLLLWYAHNYKINGKK